MQKCTRQHTHAYAHTLRITCKTERERGGGLRRKLVVKNTKEDITTSYYYMCVYKHVHVYVCMHTLTNAHVWVLIENESNIRVILKALGTLCSRLASRVKLAVGSRSFKLKVFF